MTPSIESRLVTFAFALHQDVSIRPLGLVGRVVARCERPGDLFEFRVIWWANGERKDEWLLEHELEAA